MGLTVMPADYRGFHGAHAGETIWVVGSGASVDYVDASFFRDKVTVCVNNVGASKGLDHYYTVTHYHRDAVPNARRRPDLPVIAPVHDLGKGGPEEWRDGPIDDANIYFIPTGPQMYGAFDADAHWPTDPDTLVAGPTSLHMTMHFAATLTGAGGAIVLLGADCGFIDDRSNFHGYTRGDNPMDVWQRTLPGVARRIRGLGVAVHSLNPWANLALEGHTYYAPAPPPLQEQP